MSLSLFHLQFLYQILGELATLEAIKTIEADFAIFFFDKRVDCNKTNPLKLLLINIINCNLFTYLAMTDTCIMYYPVQYWQLINRKIV